MAKQAGGRGNKIVDLKKITSELIENLHQSRERWGDDTSRITNRETQIAKATIKSLKNESKRNKESQHLKVETFNRYITRLRTKVREAGFTHPTYVKNLSGIAAKYPKYAKELETISSLKYYDSKSALTDLINQLKLELEKLSGKEKESMEKLKDFLADKCLKNIDPAILKKLVRSEEDHAEKFKLAAERVERYQDADFDKVYDYKEIVPLIPELLTTSTMGDGWQKVALGIALATGRRSYEVFYLSSFEAKAGRKIKVTGFAKKRAGEGQHETVTFPCLADPQLVVEAVERLRSCSRIASLISRIDQVDSYDAKNEILNNSVHKQSNDCASRVLGGLITTTDGKLVQEWAEGGKRATGVPFKLTRDLYINCAYQEFKANGGTAKPEIFIRDNLHHTDIKTANSYKKLHAKDEVTAAEVKQTLKIKAEFKDLTGERIQKLEELAGTKAITEKKAFIKAMAFVVEQVKADATYAVSTYNLRNALPSETSKSGFKPVIRPALIGEFVKLVQKAELDQPM